MRLTLPSLGGKKKKKDGLLNDAQRENADRKMIKILVFMTMVFSGMTYTEVSELKNSIRTNILPFGDKVGDMWISGQDASLSYLRRISRLFVSCYGTISAGTVDSKFAEIMMYVHPSNAESVRKHLMERGKLIKRYRSIAFIADLDETRKIEKRTLAGNEYPNVDVAYRLTVPVSTFRLVGDEKRPGMTGKLVLDYTIEDGRFYILDIKGDKK